MAFDERLQFLLLGLVIGFVFGYLTRLMQKTKEIKEELDEVDSIVKDIRDHDERGFIKLSFTKVALALIVGLTAYAAFVSQKASNEVKSSTEEVKISTERNEIVTYCNLTVTSRALTALNERSTYTLGNTQSNVDLQTDFAEFFNLLLHQPPYNEEKRLAAAQKYQASLNNFVALANKTTDKLEENPFPTVDDLVDCIKVGEVPGNNLELYLDKEKLKGEQ